MLIKNPCHNEICADNDIFCPTNPLGGIRSKLCKESSSCSDPCAVCSQIIQDPASANWTICNRIYIRVSLGKFHH